MHSESEDELKEEKALMVRARQKEDDAKSSVLNETRRPPQFISLKQRANKSLDTRTAYERFQNLSAEEKQQINVAQAEFMRLSPKTRRRRQKHIRKEFWESKKQKVATEAPSSKRIKGTPWTGPVPWEPQYAPRKAKVGKMKRWQQRMIEVEKQTSQTEKDIVVGLMGGVVLLMGGALLASPLAPVGIAAMVLGAGVMVAAIAKILWRKFGKRTKGIEPRANIHGAAEEKQSTMDVESRNERGTEAEKENLILSDQKTEEVAQIEADRKMALDMLSQDLRQLSAESEIKEEEEEVKANADQKTAEVAQIEADEKMQNIIQRMVGAVASKDDVDVDTVLEVGKSAVMLILAESGVVDMIEDPESYRKVEGELHAKMSAILGRTKREREKILSKRR